MEPELNADARSDTQAPPESLVLSRTSQTISDAHASTNHRRGISVGSFACEECFNIPHIRDSFSWSVYKYKGGWPTWITVYDNEPELTQLNSLLVKDSTQNHVCDACRRAFVKDTHIFRAAGGLYIITKLCGKPV